MKEKLSNIKKISYNHVFLVLFVFLIAFPILLAHRDKEERVSYSENRMLAAYPSISVDGSFNTNILADYDNWLSDNLRGRTIMVELYSRLQDKLFGRIVKSDVLKGKDSWTYTNDPLMIADFAHTNLLSKEELDADVALFSRLSAYLDAQDIKFYYFPCYDKVSIYPEYFDKGVIQNGNVSRSDQFLSELKANTDITIVDPKESLLSAKMDSAFDPDDDSKCALYYKIYDTNHWNAAGAHIGYELLMDTVSLDNPDYSIHILQPEEYEIAMEEIHADIYGYEYPLSELQPSYLVKNKKATDLTDWAIENRTYLHHINFTHEYDNPEAENDLTVLVISDSFIRMFLTSDIAESFRHTLTVDLTNIQDLDVAIASCNPDILILENTEYTYPQVMEMLRNASWLP